MTNRFERVGILVPKDERVIPMLVEPPFAFLFQQFEVDDASDFVLLFPRNMKLDDIIVSVQVLALPVVAEQTVTGAKRNSTHDSKRHCNDLLMDDFSLCWTPAHVGVQPVHRRSIPPCPDADDSLARGVAQFRIFPVPFGVAPSFFVNISLDRRLQVDPRLVGQTDHNKHHVR